MADDIDEGLGAYDDCEMMPNDIEPSAFKFENEDDHERPKVALKETPEKKVSGVPVAK